MLKRANRIHGRRQPRIVMKHGRSARTSDFQIKYIFDEKQEEFQASVVVSTKVAKSAPVRNRIRRRIYEALRTGPDFNPKAKFIITVFNVQMADLPHNQLLKQLQELFAKTPLINN